MNLPGWTPTRCGITTAAFPGKVTAIVSGKRGEWRGIVWRENDPGRTIYGPFRTKSDCQRWAAYYAGEIARATVGAVLP